MSHRLKQRGLAHLVLERHRIAERWRSERWDGLRFQFPNWSVRLPDFPFPHSDPDAFATSGEIMDFISAYAAFVAPPIRCGVDGDAAAPARWRVRLRRRDLGTARSRPTMSSSPPVPTSARSCPTCCATTPASFRCTPAGTATPASFRPGAVLVVGSGASGAQIAEELLRAGRRVYLSVGRHTPHAAPIPRTRSDLVAERDGHRSDAGRTARTRRDCCR